MIKFIKNFRKDEDGAVTVDWVVLTAAVAALAGVAYTSISTGVDTLADGSEAQLGAAVSTSALITQPTP
ncbi:hypothetical protein [Epibacterium ulvae]|uniref:hypothetical protein n=1 Tax=Epibacterium ulvae TaxID=1156985 RepID=UPI00248F7BFC|nr:hypothetical protein [Epibacterium ulvae]